MVEEVRCEDCGTELEGVFCRTCDGGHVHRAWYRTSKDGSNGTVNLSDKGARQYREAGYVLTEIPAPWEERKS